MIHRSSYPPVTVELPHTNAHNLLFPPDVVNSEPNFVMHIDGLSGEERTRKQVLERFYDGATALTTPESAGGLGISRDSGEIVAIQSHNSLVSIAADLNYACFIDIYSAYVGILYPGAFTH